MEPNNTPGNTNPDANLEGAPNGIPAVGGQNPQEPSIPLSELKSVLGKNWADKSTALASLKEMQSYTGKVGQLENEVRKLQSQPLPAATGEMAELKAQLENIQKDTFFERNAEFKSIRPVVETFSKARGKTLSETVELPEVKELLAKVSGFEQSQKMRTVLESNPRLASSQDKMTKAQELSSTRSRKALREGADLAVGAVMDAYPEYLGK